MNFQLGPDGIHTSGGYTLPSSFPGWSSVTNTMISTTLGASSSLVINFPCTQGYEPVAISADGQPDTPCQATNFEINMCNWNGGLNTYQDSYDISLDATVLTIAGRLCRTPGLPAIVCCRNAAIQQIPDVFPWGCATCGVASTVQTAARPCPAWGLGVQTVSTRQL